MNRTTTVLAVVIIACLLVDAIRGGTPASPAIAAPANQEFKRTTKEFEAAPGPVGRYQICIGKVAGADVVCRIDTTTGRVWWMQEVMPLQQGVEATAAWIAYPDDSLPYDQWRKSIGH